jgi:hypothetical protein
MDESIAAAWSESVIVPDVVIGTTQAARERRDGAQPALSGACDHASINVALEHLLEFGSPWASTADGGHEMASSVVDQKY